MTNKHVELNMDYIKPMIQASGKTESFSINYLNQLKEFYISNTKNVCDMIMDQFKNLSTGYIVTDPANCFIVCERDVTTDRSYNIIESETYSLDIEFLKYMCKKRNITTLRISKMLDINYNIACTSSKNISGSSMLEIAAVLNCNPADLVRHNKKEEDYEEQDGILLYSKYKVDYKSMYDLTRSKNFPIDSLWNVINVEKGKFHSMTYSKSQMFGKDILAISKFLDVDVHSLIVTENISPKISKAKQVSTEIKSNKEYDIDYEYVCNKIKDQDLKMNKMSLSFGYASDWFTQKKRGFRKLKGFDVIKLSEYINCDPQTIICHYERQKGFVIPEKHTIKKIRLNRSVLFRLTIKQNLTLLDLNEAIGKHKANSFAVKYVNKEQLESLSKLLSCSPQDISESNKYMVDYRIIDILCNALRISYSFLSEKINESPEYISKCFRSEAKMDKETILNICKVLNCRFEDLVMNHSIEIDLEKNAYDILKNDYVRSKEEKEQKRLSELQGAEELELQNVMSLLAEM